MAVLLALAIGATVVSGHPRIYLRQGDLAALRTRAKATPKISGYYKLLKAAADGRSARSGNDEVAGFELESLALCHVVEHPSLVYRDKALAGWLRTSYAAGSMSHWDLPFAVMSHALALDWMWADLTAQQRTAIGNALVAMMDDLYGYASHWDSANQMSDYSNQFYFHLGALAFAGAVLSGEGINDTRAAFYLGEAERNLGAGMLPAMNQEAGGDSELGLTSGLVGNGGWGEDMGHLQMTHPLLGRMLEAWRTSTGQDLFPRFNGLAKINQYALYLRRPNGKLSPKGNADYDRSFSDKHMGTLGALTSTRYQDKMGKLVKDLTYGRKAYGFHQLGPVLWYNEKLADLDLTQLPRSILFQGQGEVVVRSGFDANSTWVYLRSGPIYSGHQHDDQGNLLIEAHGSELFVENAGHGNDETINHNTLRIGGDQIAYGDNALQFARPVAGTTYERGKITQFTQGPTFTYAASDFGNAYPTTVVSPPRAGKVTREVVTVLPDIVVVRDRVTATGAVEFLLHTWMTGTTTTVDAASKTITAVRGSGRAWVKTLLPAAAKLTNVVQGQTRLLTVTPTRPQATETLLHVFYLSPSATPFTPVDLTLIDEGGAQGARLTDRQGNSWEVRFTKGSVGLDSVRKIPLTR